MDCRRVTRSISASSTVSATSPSSASLTSTIPKPKARLKRLSTAARQRPDRRPQSRHVFPTADASSFGIIQENIAHNLYHLVIQAMLWNQTSGIQARPVFFALIEKYPDPMHLSQASVSELTAMLRPLGLQNIRAKRCIALALRWVENPPTPMQQYVRKGYPSQGASNEGYEIAHLPGVGPYALDSFRIFHRDEMRGLAGDWLGNGSTSEHFEPEWKRVLPKDKELRAYLRWRWLKEGFLWNDETGERVSA